MIIDSPIISGSSVASGSLNQFGNVTITGSLNVTGGITGSISGTATSASYASNAELLDGLDSTVFTLTSSFSAFSASLNAFSASILAQTASFNAFSASINTATSSFSGRVGALESYTSSLNNKTSSFATTGSNTFNGTQTTTGSILQSGSFTSTGTITAQTLIVQTVTSSTVYSSGSNIFGNSLANTQVLTGSVSITGSLAVNGSNVVLSNQTSSMSASYALNAASASYAANATSASYANNATSASYSLVATSASYANNTTSASFASTAASGTGSFTGSFNGTHTGSLLGTASRADNATSASYSNNSTSASYANNATTASYALVAAAGGFPYTGSAQITGSLGVTGSVSATSFTGSLLGTSSYSVYSLTSSYSLAGSGFPFSGSAVITGSLLVTNLSSSGVSYLVADAAGFVTAQTASAAIKSTQAVTSTAGQTSFNITNGYTTGLVDVYINGTKLSAVEYTDTSGTVITLATGSNNGDTVEFVKYFPASGVTNNALRQQTTITASAGQTVFSASYTPGLLDIFYNGARLTPADFTANNGTYFTLATASAASDILDVLVYSYQVGAFSGIGGTGVANQFAYFTSTNAVTSSTAITISGANAIVTGSLLGTASYSNDAGTLDGLDSTVFTLTSSFNAQTASFTAFTSSINSFSASVLTFTGSAATRLSALEAATASLYTATSSFSGRVGALEAATSSLYSYTSSLNNKTASFATTGSNTFIGTQTISGSILQSGSFTSTGTLTAQTLVVQTITSSVVYSSGSNIFGNALNNSQTFTGSVLITGSLTIAGASSATSYSGATIYGSTAVCSPVGKFTSCVDAGSGTFSGNLLNTNSNFQTYGSASFGVSTWGLSIGNGNASANYSKANDHYFQNGAGTQILTINSTGVATFTNIICSAGVKTTDSIVLLKNAASDNRYIQFCDTNTGGYRYDFILQGTANGCGFGLYNNTTAAWSSYVTPNGNTGLGGTTSPGGRLEVWQCTNNRLVIDCVNVQNEPRISSLDSANNPQYLTINSYDLKIKANGNEALRITDKKHLLVGTQTDLSFYSNWDSGVTRIGTSGVLFSYLNNSDNFIISQNYYVNAAGNDVRISSGPAANIYFASGDILFRTIGTGAAESTTSWNTPLRLTCTGASLISGCATFYCTAQFSKIQKSTDGNWYKIPFRVDKNTGSGTATTYCIVDINNMDTFSELIINIDYGSRLQAVSDASTQISSRMYGVNRFNSGTVAITDSCILIGSSGNINTHAPITVAVVNDCRIVVKVDFSSGVSYSSFVWGEIKIFSVESLNSRLTIPFNTWS